MSETFAATASRLAGLATRAFGWLPHQFWQVTPAELSAAFAVDDAAPDAVLLTRADLELMLERENHDR